eukprot:5313830-Pyramimonas_sp.AAC.1
MNQQRSRKQRCNVDLQRNLNSVASTAQCQQRSTECQQRSVKSEVPTNGIATAQCHQRSVNSAVLTASCQQLSVNSVVSTA